MNVDSRRADANHAAGTASFGEADNWRRWVGVDWSFIEHCGPAHGSDWNAQAEQRLKKFADYGHRLGYFVSFYSINGFTPSENQGWTDEFNFGSKNAAAKAHR